MKAVLAIAIEDRVDLWLQDLEGTKKTLPPVSQEIPEGSDYFSKVHDLLAEMIGKLCASIHGGALTLFNSTIAVVVSSCGVIEEHRTLIQLPLWHFEMAPDKMVHWKIGDEIKDGFDFREVLSGIGAKLIEAEGKTWSARARKAFEKQIYVVNDATASAAFENSRRKDPKPDFIYIKAHNGINIGIIQPGRDGRDEKDDKWHPEAGHGFPRRHKYDHQAMFGGICPFHKWCYEGYIAAYSFYRRAVNHPHPEKKFEPWTEYVEELTRQGLEGQKRDNALLQYLLGDDTPESTSNREAVDIIAHYIGQLAMQLSLLAPQHIVIGGRLATPEVIVQVQANILKWVHGYPRRDALSTSEGIARHIVPSKARPKEKDTIEVRGAMSIALLRAVGRPQ